MEEGPCCWLRGKVDILAPEMEKEKIDIEELTDILTLLGIIRAFG